MIKVKTGVKPKMLVIMAAVANVAHQMQDEHGSFPREVLITSGNDGRHMLTSRHYSNDALDVRTKTFGTLGLKQQFVAQVLARLGRDYQGILESVGKPNEHAHFEYDPPAKRRARRLRP